MAKSPSPMADLFKAWFYILLAGVFLFTLAWLVNAMLPPAVEVSPEGGPQSEQSSGVTQSSEEGEPGRKVEVSPAADKENTTSSGPEGAGPVDSDGTLGQAETTVEQNDTLSPPEEVAQELANIAGADSAAAGGAEIHVESPPLVRGDNTEAAAAPPEDQNPPILRFSESERNVSPAVSLPLPETTHFESEPPPETVADAPPASEAGFCLPLGEGTAMAEPDLEGFVLLKNEGAAFVAAAVRGTIVKTIHSPYTGRTVYQLESGGNRCFLYGGVGELAAGVAVGTELDCGAAIGGLAEEGVYFSVSTFAEGQLWWQGKRIDPRPFISHAH